MAYDSSEGQAIVDRILQTGTHNENKCSIYFYAACLWLKVYSGISIPGGKTLW